jgi:hypothetical protein
MREKPPSQFGEPQERKMKNDVRKKPEDELRNVDGFDGFTEETEGTDQDHFASGRVIQGTRINFTNEATWVDAAKQKLPADLEPIVVDNARVVQKWGKDNLPSPDEPPIILGPNEKWPDIEAMNNKCPKTEWRERHGKLEGPYQAQRVVYLIDPKTMDKYSWPTSTIGGRICIGELVDKTKLMRQFRGQRVYAVVKLSSTLMSKRYNRQRPDLIVLRWVTLDGSGALATPETHAITGPATTPNPANSKTATTDQLGMRTVTPPTAKEVTGDEIRF